MMTTRLKGLQLRKGAALLLMACMGMTAAAQEKVQLLYKDGSKKEFAIKDIHRISFLDDYYYLDEEDMGDTLYMSASATNARRAALVRSNDTWSVEATEGKEWLMAAVNKDSKAMYGLKRKDNYFMIYTKANLQDTDRTGKITITSNSGLKRDIVVVQRGYTLSFLTDEFVKDPRFEGRPLTEQRETFAKEAATYTIKAVPNEGWTIESCPEWIKPQPMEHAGVKTDFAQMATAKNIWQCAGEINSTCTFNIDANTSDRLRMGKIVLAYGDQKLETVIRQKGTGGNASVIIEENANPNPYNPMIFGGFVEHFNRQVYGGIFEPGSPLSDEKGFRLDVLEALKEIKVPVIRWPGGCYVDGYHWVNGVGPVRKVTDDISWGVKEPNTFGTDEFVEFCRRLNSEPYICHNSFAGLQEMGDWVEYCNLNNGKYADMRKEYGHAEPHNVKIWSVGNEHGGGEYYKTVRDGAKKMKEVDPNVLVTCSGTHGYSWIDPELFEIAGEYLDYVSIHQYWIQNFQQLHKPDYMTCIGMSEGPSDFIKGVVNSLEDNKMRGKIKLAFDEWNLRSWYHPGFPRNYVVDYGDPSIKQQINERNKSLDNTIYTMADALFSASFFNACLENSDDVIMANVAPMVNQTGPLYVHKEGIVRRPHFYTMKMYANLLEAHVAPTEVVSDNLAPNCPVIDVLATTSKDGKRWAISLVNRDPKKALSCQIQLGKDLLNGTFKASVLEGDSPDAYNSVQNPDRVIPVEKTIEFDHGTTQLPAHSLTIFFVEK